MYIITWANINIDEILQVIIHLEVGIMIAVEEGNSIYSIKAKSQYQTITHVVVVL